MIIERIYWDRQDVIRIYQGGRLIWPADQVSTDAVMSLTESLFSNGYHAMVDSDAIVLAPSADIVAAVHGELVASQAAVLNPQNDNVFAVHGGLSVIHLLPLVHREDNVTTIRGDLLPVSITSFIVKEDNVAAVHGEVGVLHIVTFAQREDNVTTIHGGFVTRPPVSLVVQQHNITPIEGDMLTLPSISLDDVTDIVSKLHSNMHVAHAPSFDHESDTAAVVRGSMLPAPADVLNHIVNGAANPVGEHELSVTEAAIINSHADNNSAISATLSTLFAKNIVTLECGVDSFSQDEIEAFLGNALSCTFMEDSSTSESMEMSFYWHKRMSHSADYATDADAAMQPAPAASGTHTEDIASADELNARVAGSSRISHKEDMDVTDKAHAEVATAAHMPGHVEDSGTTNLATMMPIKASDIVHADVAEDNAVCDEAHIDSYEYISMGALLHLVTTCNAGMHIAHASGMSVDVASKTGIIAVLDFDGAEPEIMWYDPVQTGSNLYIRSVWLFWHDRDMGYIDVVEFYPPVRNGNDLYIRSAWNSYQDQGNACIDMDVFYTPVQTDDNLYIRSTDHFWTDGSSGNIDTDVFLEPVQDGSNLYIRQNIFGGE